MAIPRIFEADVGDRLATLKANREFSIKATFQKPATSGVGQTDVGPSYQYCFWLFSAHSGWTAVTAKRNRHLAPEGFQSIVYMIGCLCCFE